MEGGDCKGSSDRGLGFGGWDKGVFGVAVDEGGFTYALAAEDDEFGLERGRGFCCTHFCLFRGVVFLGYPCISGWDGVVNER